MTTIDTHELAAVIGGFECRGLWLGTNDGKYGLCLGQLLEN